MKTCKQCRQLLPLESFYPHKETKDKRFPKCKSCIRENRIKRLMLIPGWEERQSNRDKNTAKCPKERRRRFDKKFPEKRLAYIATRKLPREKGCQLHHWSYNQEHQTDVFPIRRGDHKLIHKHLRYDREHKMYRRKDNGDLLDTREKHESFINSILSKKNNNAEQETNADAAV